MRRFLAVLSRLEKLIILVSFTIMALILVIDVIGREIISTGIVGAGRMSVLPLAIMAFFAIGLSSENDSHLRARVFDKIVPARFDATMTVVKELITAAFCALVTYSALLLVLESIEYGEKTRLLGWDLWPFQLSFVLAFAIATLRHLCFALIPSTRPHVIIDVESGMVEARKEPEAASAEGKGAGS